MRYISRGRYGIHREVDQGGYMLIEVVISLFLVYLMAGLVLNVIAVGSVGVSSSGQHTQAIAYGSSLLEEMKVHPDRFIILGEPCSFNAGEANFLVSEPEGMTAEVEGIPLASVPKIYRVSIHISGEQGGRLWEECLLGFVRIDSERL